jgi:hypothetical protein
MGRLTGQPDREGGGIGTSLSSRDCDGVSRPNSRSKRENRLARWCRPGSLFLLNARQCEFRHVRIQKFQSDDQNVCSSILRAVKVRAARWFETLAFRGKCWNLWAACHGCKCRPQCVIRAIRWQTKPLFAIHVLTRQSLPTNDANTATRAWRSAVGRNRRDSTRCHVGSIPGVPQALPVLCLILPE